MSNSDSDIAESNSDFGSVLAEARKSQNYTVGEISEYLKIPAHVIAAIEANDLDTLPAATFTQGYIRAYAKFLEISEDNVLEIYNRAVPHDRATDLKPRSNLPGEANSQSPLVKTVTMFLIVAGIAAVIYGSFQYYQQKANVMEDELESKEPSFTGNSLDSPGSQRLSVKQNARLTDDDELIVGQSDPFERIVETRKTEKEESGINESAMDTDAAETSEELVAEAEAVPEETEEMKQNDIQHDVIKFIAEKGSWMEVRDASNARLFYNMVPVGGSKTLSGQAPFRVSLGNAKTTRVVINDLEIDMTDYIRSNNTAVFTVSSEQQNVIFH